MEFLHLLNYINNKIKHKKYIKILNSNLSNKIINFNLLIKMEQSQCNKVFHKIIKNNKIISWNNNKNLLLNKKFHKFKKNYKIINNINLTG